MKYECPQALAREELAPPLKQRQVRVRIKHSTVRGLALKSRQLPVPEILAFCDVSFTHPIYPISSP